MNTHAIDTASHGGHEREDFQGTYAIWAIPFSMLLLAIFVFIVSLWVPAAATREMRTKEVQGAEQSRRELLEHRAAEQQSFASAAVPIEAAMRRLSSDE